MAYLQNLQKQIDLSTLYEIELVYTPFNTANTQRQPNVWINTGAVDIYASNSSVQPTALSQMTLTTQETDVNGLRPFATVPRYIAVITNSGTPTEVVLTAINVKENLGAIA